MNPIDFDGSKNYSLKELKEFYEFRRQHPTPAADAELEIYIYRKPWTIIPMKIWDYRHALASGYLK